MKALFLFRRFAAVLAVAAVTACGVAQAASAPGRIYSIRTEPGAHGHIVTTTAFSVRVGGKTYLCVISEDDGFANQGQTPIALAQSCDFSESR